MSKQQERDTSGVTLAAFAGVTLIAYLAGCGLLYLVFRIFNDAH